MIAIVFHHTCLIINCIGILQLAKKGARCDYGIFMGASSTNFEEIIELAPHVVGLKMYLNETFTTLKLDGIQQWLKVRMLIFFLFLCNSRGPANSCSLTLSFNFLY